MAAFLTAGDAASSPAATFVGVIGDFASLILMLVPLLAVNQIRINRSVENVSPYPWLATLFSCCVWALYALLKNNSVVLYINGIGALLQLGYTMVYLKYADEDDEARQWSIVVLVLEALGVGALAVLGCFFDIITPDTFGYLGAVSSIVMYAVPLYTTYQAYQAENMEKMNPVLSIAMVANAVCWIIYAIIVKDNFVMGSNLIGLVCVVLQLALYIKLLQH